MIRLLLAGEVCFTQQIIGQEMAIVYLLLVLMAVGASGDNTATIQSANGNLVFGLPLGSSIIVQQAVNLTGTVTIATDTLVNLSYVNSLLAPLTTQLQNVTNQLGTVILQLQSEQYRALAVENSLSNQISILTAQLQSQQAAANASLSQLNASLTMALNAQVQSATAIQNSLSQSILVEKSRASANDASVIFSSNSMSSNLVLSVASEVSRATLTENSLSTVVLQTSSSLAVSVSNERSRAISLENSLSSNALQVAASVSAEVARASGVEGSLASSAILTSTSLGASVASERSRAIVQELSLATSSLQTTSSLAIADASEVTRATRVESSMSLNVLQTSASIASSVELERSRATAAESLVASNGLQLSASIATSVANVVSRAVGVDASISVAALVTSDSLGQSIASEVQRATAAEASLAASSVQVSSSISSSIAVEASRNNFDESVTASRGSPARLSSQIARCVPSTWSTTISGGVNTALVGCSVTITLVTPSVVMAMLTGHAQVASNWLYTGISFNGDNNFVTDVCCAINNGMQFSPAHTYIQSAAGWENQRTARASFFNPGTVTITVKWFASTTAYMSGFALHALAISANPYSNIITPGNIFGCTFSAWGFPIPVNSNAIACTASFTPAYPAIAWSFFGGHQSQTGGGSFGFVSYDGNAVGPLSNYSAVNAAFSPNTNWESFSTARITTVAPGTHTSAMSFFAPTGAGSPAFNGGALQGFFIPQDTSVTNQVFSCRLPGLISVPATVVTACSVTITLPYRAAVWAQFTGQVRAPTGLYWVFASIDFDGDAAPLVNAASSADPNFLALGPAHTYVQSFKAFGQGRVAILQAGTHTVSVVARSAVAGGSMQAMGMEGFFVPN